MKPLIPLVLLLLACAPKAVGPVPAPGAAVVEVGSEKVKVLHQPPMPHYPREALLQGISGPVVVEVTIDPKGVPIQVKAISGRLELREVSVAYVMNWRFEPVLLQGIPQYARFRFPIAWHMD